MRVNLICLTKKEKQQQEELSTPAIKTLENSGSGITKTEMEIRKLYFEKFKKIKKNKKK